MSRPQHGIHGGQGQQDTPWGGWGGVGWVGVSPPSGITGDFEQSINVLPKQEHWGWCIESGVALGEIS